MCVCVCVRVCVCVCVYVCVYVCEYIYINIQIRGEAQSESKTYDLSPKHMISLGNSGILPGISVTGVGVVAPRRCIVCVEGI